MKNSEAIVILTDIYRRAIITNGNVDDENNFKIALSKAIDALLINKKLKEEFSDKELQMINIGLDTAMAECQLPDIGEEGYKDVLSLKLKLGIAQKEDIVCPKCGSSTKFHIRGNFGGALGVFTCYKCQYEDISTMNMKYATDDDWEQYWQETEGVMF